MAMANPVEKFAEKKKRQPAFTLALIEFAVMFLSEIGWNLVRKTGQSMLDSFGIALLTAIFLYAFHRE
jgi:hypothetical protein